MGFPPFSGVLVDRYHAKEKVHTFCQVALATPQVTVQRRIACWRKALSINRGIVA